MVLDFRILCLVIEKSEDNYIDVIKKMKEDGITNINALVSGSNLGVLNLYSKFGFRFSNTLFGYRKIRS